MSGAGKHPRWLAAGLDAAYLLLLALLVPWLLYRRWRLNKDRQGLWGRFLGRLPGPTPGRRRIWLHAVSVGEVMQLGPILERLHAAFPDDEFLITTATTAGLDVARRRYPQHLAALAPLDFSWAVRRALTAAPLRALVLVELELWPNLVLTAAELAIPVALINVRITERSYRGYRRILPLARRMLRSLAGAAAQNETYADRLRQLGMPPDRLFVPGSIKFDGVSCDRDSPAIGALRAAFGLQPEELVFLAGSTQAPEEEIALDVWAELRQEFPGLRLMLSPRHPERFDEAARLVRERGFPVARRTALARAGHEGNSLGRSRELPPVLLLDTLGELASAWGLASVAFVGGSLTRRGGQNMIEPAARGVPVLFGPNTWNFRDAVAMLLDAGAASVVRDRNDLARALRELLSQPSLREVRGEAGRRLVISQQGAAARTADWLRALLDPPVSAARAA